MMPRAKTVSRRNMPPLNRSMKPKREPEFCWKNSARRLASIPGVGMCPPKRYTANKPSVKKMRFRRSGIRNILAIVSNSFIVAYLGASLNRSCLLTPDYISTAAGLLDFLQGRLRKYVRPDLDFAGDVARAQHLQPGAQFLDDAEFKQPSGIERAAVQLLQTSHIYDGIFFLKNVGEPALGQAAMQGH